MKKKHSVRNDSGECLSIDMVSDPTNDQLQDRDGDALSAKMAYAMDSGLGRMKKSKTLYEQLEKLSKGETDGTTLPQQYESLAREITNENSSNNLQRIVESFKKKIDRRAKLLACAACGMRNFNMGSNRFRETKLSQLNILMYTEEERSK